MLHPYRLALCDNLLRRKGSISIHGLEVFGEGVAREMQQVRLEVPYGPLDPHTFLDEIADPFGLPAMIQPDLAIRIPARVENPATDILREPRHRVRVERRAVFFDLPDLAFERFA